MSARRFGTQSLVRLLGNWQETQLTHAAMAASWRKRSAC
ncbi:GntR family transcriptional regulator [Klebsiella pneumoniae]|nr:GntR family transcriptional regulator [Klebsiella pneumoniae]